MAIKVLSNEEIFDLVLQIQNRGRAINTQIEMKGKTLQSIKLQLEFEFQEDVINFYNNLKESK